MADGTVQVNLGSASAAPLSYTVPASQVLDPKAIRAVFDGTGAAGAFLPAIQYVNANGTVMAQTIGTSVAAGGSADATFFRGVRPPGSSPFSFTYQQVIAALKASYTCVAEWQLDEGAEPYLDTSGYSAVSPANMHIEVRFVPLTPNYASGPLTDSPTGPSVKFNFDGDSRTSSGDYLTDTIAPPTRYAFLGNAVFTAVAWLKPTQGVATHYGPVLNTVTPVGGTHDEGWRINVQSPTQECRLERWCNVGAGGTPEYYSLGSLSTTLWTMVAMVYDGSNIIGYANGARVGSAASAGSIGSGTNMIIGAGTHSLSDYVTWYYGAASQISVWANAFTDADVAALYAAGIG